MVITNYIAEEDVGDNGVHFYDPDTGSCSPTSTSRPGADDADLTADGRYRRSAPSTAGMSRSSTPRR